MTETIRSAVPDDISKILRIAERGWNAAYGEFLCQETIDRAMVEWYDPDTTRKQIEHSDVAYFVAEQHGRLLGYASGGPSEVEMTASLNAIYVDPSHWGNGIGTALLDAFENFCRQHGYNKIQFQVLVENNVGLSFYRKHGYEAIDEQDTELFGESVREYTFQGVPF